jgi:hypothetical protein
MTYHPEFPQESPAMKYIVDQVSKIEDAQACGVGYYKSLSKVLARLDKTDTILNQLNQSTTDLRKITDSDDMNAEIQRGLTYISDKNVKAINENLKEMGAEVKKAAGEVMGANNFVERVGSDLHSTMGVAIDRLDKHIKDVDERIMPPLWKIYVYTFVALLLGIAIGKWT